MHGSRSIRHLLPALALAGALQGACAEDLSTRLEPDAAPSVDGPITVENLGDGVHRARVQAKDEIEWVYMNLEQGKWVPAEPEPDAAAWDLAFRRFNMKLNGGASGGGDAAVIPLPGAVFDDIDAVPADAMFLTDEPDADADGVPEYVMSIGDNRWYAYDVATHVLMPKDMVYVVKGATGSYYKLQMLEYYDMAGTPGYPAFRWAVVDGPAAAPAVVRAASRQ
jgi:hypothetical protein